MNNEVVFPTEALSMISFCSGAPLGKVSHEERYSVLKKIITEKKLLFLYQSNRQYLHLQHRLWITY